MAAKLTLEYDGTPFAGWAAQPGQRTVAGELRLDRLGLGLRGLDPLVVDHLDAQVGQKGLPVRGVARELVTGLLVAHGE